MRIYRVACLSPTHATVHHPQPLSHKSTSLKTFITRFVHTPTTTASPSQPGLAPSTENDDEVDFLGFESVLQEAENLKDKGTANESDSDN